MPDFRAEQAMMLGFHNRPNEHGYRWFSYHLAYELKRTVQEIEAMPHTEYLGWAAYFTAKVAIENKTPAGP